MDLSPPPPLRQQSRSGGGRALTLPPVFQLKKVRSLLLAGAAEFDGFLQQLRLMEAAFKLSAKDLRSQVVREACITLG